MNELKYLNYSRRDLLNIYYGETKEIEIVSVPKDFKEGYTNLILDIKSMVSILCDLQTSKQNSHYKILFYTHTCGCTHSHIHTDIHIVLMLYVSIGFQRHRPL